MRVALFTSFKRVSVRSIISRLMSMRGRHTALIYGKGLQGHRVEARCEVSPPASNSKC